MLLSFINKLLIYIQMEMNEKETETERQIKMEILEGCLEEASRNVVNTIAEHQVKKNCLKYKYMLN